MSQRFERWSPPVELSYLTTSQRARIIVVRDDLLPGGTKQRGAIPFLLKCKENGVHEFVYASPFSGYAQVALAKSCANLGFQCTIFAERDRISQGVSEFTAEAKNIAGIHLCDNLLMAETEANYYSESKSYRFKIPLGFNDGFYRQCLKESLAIQWNYLCEKLGFIPARLWLPLGSGILIEVFKEIFPAIACVDVRILPPTDERITKIKKTTEYYSAPESFHQPVIHAPQIPSNRFYDAKVWQFIDRFGRDGDVWWNVA